MSIEAKCPQCGSSHLVNDRLAGRRIRCPKCNSAVAVPELNASPITPSLSSTDLADSGRAGREGIASSKSNGDLSVPSNASDSDGIDASRFAAAKRNTPSLVGSSVSSLPDSRASAVSKPQGPRDPKPPAPPVQDEEDDPLPEKLKASDGELDMTPMVDVTFLLLIFFMITAAFSLQKSLESPRQQSDQASSQQKEEEEEELDLVTVQINEYGSYLVMAPDWERETPGKQNLIVALSEAIGNGDTAMKLDIQVHESAKLQALVDCMDAGTICNYGDVQVTQVDGFD